MHYEVRHFILIWYIITNAIAFGILDAREKCSWVVYSSVLLFHGASCLVLIAITQAYPDSGYRISLILGALFELLFVCILPVSKHTKILIIGGQWFSFGIYKALVWYTYWIGVVPFNSYAKHSGN